MDLSIIVPFYNEEENIEAMYQNLTAALAPLNLKYELLFVDDGSSDATFNVGQRLAEKDRSLRLIKFRKNYGQTPATVAGINQAKGDILITMDGDLQNDPSDIPLFLGKIGEGFDIVVGWRQKRQDNLVTRKIPSIVANWLIGKITGVNIKDSGCSLRAYKKDVIKNIPLYSEMHRFIPAMLSMSGARIAEIKVKHHPRQFGQSKYGLSRIFKVFFDLLTIKTLVSFSAKPLAWFSYLSLPGFMVGLIAFIYSLNSSLINSNSSIVIPMGISLVFFSLGFFSLFCGILCELIYKTGDIKLENISSLTSKTIKYGNDSPPA
jgi:glycosyltransferase involved in cell wall biosynthesis